MTILLTHFITQRYSMIAFIWVCYFDFHVALRFKNKQKELDLIKKLLTCCLVVTLAGCFEQKQEFNEEDFVGATKFFCQNGDFKGSPLEANTFSLYYNKENGLGNIGIYVYSESVEDNVAEVFLYQNDNALVLDNTINFIFEPMGEYTNGMSISIDRKTLSVTKNYKEMVCTTSSEEFTYIKASLVKEHLNYKSELEKINKI